MIFTRSPRSSVGGCLFVCAPTAISIRTHTLQARVSCVFYSAVDLIKNQHHTNITRFAAARVNAQFNQNPVLPCTFSYINARCNAQVHAIQCCGGPRRRAAARRARRASPAQNSHCPTDSLCVLSCFCALLLRGHTGGIARSASRPPQR